MKTRIAVLAFAVFSSLALAQPDSASMTGNKPPNIAKMQDALGLTDEQVQKMRDIRDGGGSMSDMRAVLTPEQQVKAAQLRKEHKGDRGERKAQMQEYLGLSEEQKTKMAEIRKAGGTPEEVRAVLTPDQLAKFEAMRSKHGGKEQVPGDAAAE